MKANILNTINRWSTVSMSHTTWVEMGVLMLFLMFE
jgi:hypothetical protein